MIDFAALAQGIANEYAVKESKEKETREERTKEENKEIESKETNIYSQDKPISNNTNNITKYPSFEEVSEYIITNRLACNIDKFFSFYSRLGWKDKKGEPLQSWKNMAVAWADKEIDKEFVMRRNIEMAELRKKIETTPVVTNLRDIAVEDLPPVPFPGKVRT